MTPAQRVILAALDRGPLHYKPHAGNNWYVNRRPRTGHFGEHIRKRYFRTQDVHKVIACGLAKQIGDELVKC